MIPQRVRNWFRRVFKRRGETRKPEDMRRAVVHLSPDKRTASLKTVHALALGEALSRKKFTPSRTKKIGAQLKTIVDCDGMFDMIFNKKTPAARQFVRDVALIIQDRDTTEVYLVHLKRFFKGA